MEACEVHTFDEDLPLSDAECREFEKAAKPWRNLLAGIEAVQEASYALTAKDAKWLRDALTDVIGDCGPFNAIRDYDKNDDADAVRAAYDEMRGFRAKKLDGLDLRMADLSARIERGLGAAT